ncbi:hypothetical protein ACB095_10495, partial [Streptococcus pneumoniae]|uniref:hypothetical protein n=1 Tax=Streptococcus pneumoniae TaxID=1313 RepID=UPI003529C690
SKIGLTTTLKNAWTTSRQVNFFWVANFNLKFGTKKTNHDSSEKKNLLCQQIYFLVLNML